MLAKLDLFIGLLYALSFLNMCNYLVIDKELQVKEYARIMGLDNFCYYLAFIIQYLIIYFVISFFGSIFLKLSLYPNASNALLFLWMYFYCVTLILQAIAISLCFIKTKFGNICIVIIFFSDWVVYYASVGYLKPYYLRVLTNLISQMNFIETL